ncbi:MAG: alpha/beta hydrolase, partial [Alphaproteobacteria bacterium]
MILKTLLTFLSALILSGCTKASLAVANSPVLFFDGQIVRDLVYNEKTAQSLDIYVPAQAKEQSERLPVIMFFYGGRWSEGRKEDYAFVGMALASKGYVVVLPDYRKYPNVKFPAFVEDGAAAVQWVRNNIDEYNGNPDILFLSGHSAGAHIASLIAVDESYLNNQKSYNAIKGFAGLAGPYAFTPEADDLKDMFGPPAQYPQIRATSFIDGSEPPMLLLHGEQDNTVGLFNARRLAKAMHEENADVTVKTYPG